MLVLFHATLGGFLSDSGTYTSEWREAKQFAPAEGISLVRRAMREDAFILIPVDYNSLVVAGSAKGAH